MSRRGFSFLEILIALAILAVVSVSLAPLLTSLTAADRRNRTRAAAWRGAQAGLTALQLNDPKAWRGAAPGMKLNWEQTSGTGTVAWGRITVTPEGAEQPAAEVFVDARLRPL